MIGTLSSLNINVQLKKNMILYLKINNCLPRVIF